MRLPVPPIPPRILALIFGLGWDPPGFMRPFNIINLVQADQDPATQTV